MEKKQEHPEQEVIKCHTCTRNLYHFPNVTIKSKTCPDCHELKCKYCFQYFLGKEDLVILNSMLDFYKDSIHYEEIEKMLILKPTKFRCKECLFKGAKIVWAMAKEVFDKNK